MKRVLIVGAGGFGRELYRWASDHPDCGRKWRIEGFLDDKSPVGLPVQRVGNIAEYDPSEETALLVGMGQPRNRKKVVEHLRSRGAKFLTLVHPSAMVGAHVRLGEGTILCPHVIVTDNVNIGEFVLMNCCAGAGHDVRIGSWTTVGPKAELTGFAQIGEGVTLGAGAIVTPNVKVGEWATIGAGSAVFTNVKPGATVIGVPARPLVEL